MKHGMQLGVSNPAYHADRTAVSSTWLKIIDAKTPWHLRSYLDSPPAEPTAALLMGSMVDCLIFEPGEFDKQFIIAPEINKRTKAGREEWAALVKEANAKHMELVSNDAHIEALATAKAVRSNPVMVDLMKRGVPQPVFVWDDPVYDMRCKCKLDWYDEKTGTIFDLKTAFDASPIAFSKAVANFGYHIQAAFYMDGVRACDKPVHRFVFGVMEKPDNKNTFSADPRLMAFYELDEDDIAAGRDSYYSSMAAINFCQMNDEWAGYTNHVVPISRPAWAKRTDVESFSDL